MKAKHGDQLGELYVMDPLSFLKAEQMLFTPAEVVKYYNDACLYRIRDEHGGKLENTLKLMPDYN